MTVPRDGEQEPREPPHVAYRTPLGEAWHGDSRDVFRHLSDESVDLILTSPPFALVRKKSYGNEQNEAEYIKWFSSFVHHFDRVLKPEGSLVIDLGGAWTPGLPTKSLYQYRLLISLVDDHGFHLAQDFVWFNRAKLPGPRQWATIDRVRAKDATNTVWWLSKSPNPKADNRRVLRPYTKSMRNMIKRGSYNTGLRPSEHFIGENWAQDLGGSIPPNVIERVDSDLGVQDTILDFPNTQSREPYQVFCALNKLTAHPARFPRPVVEFFIKFLTEERDIVVDPFGGSNVTGDVAEQLGRRWVSAELDRAYIAGSLGRFCQETTTVGDRHLHDLKLKWPPARPTPEPTEPPD